MTGDDDDDEAPPSARQLAREATRDAGERSAKLASAFMKLPPPALGRLPLDEDVRDAIDRARKVTSPIARRRAERTLAGELRGHDLGELEGMLANQRAAGKAAAQPLHLAEQWRARLIEEGVAAAAELPGGTDAHLEQLVEAARLERASGKNRGAARALFRLLVERLR